MGYKIGCEPGSTYNWFCSQGTILQGQGTDSITVLWGASGFDTIHCIYNSVLCGVDTNHIPIQIYSPPTNVIVGDTFACQGTLDTFTTAVLPQLSPWVTRYWHVGGGGLNLNFPSGNQIVYTHGAGPFETLLLTNSDHGCTSRDTLHVRVDPPPAVSLGPSPVICTGDSILLDPGPGYASYAWSTGATSQTVYADTSVAYTVTVTNAPYNCSNQSTVTPILDQDCVWPGDANHDYVVDLDDFLAIGVAFGSTGGVRANASTNWTGQPAANWAQTFGSGQNYKHADCNGDGLVHFADTVSVTIHQGLTHLRIGEATAGVPLRIVPLQQTYPGNDTITLSVQLGNPGVPADSSYGLVFSLAFNPNDIVPGSIRCIFPPSILGNPWQHYMTLRRDSSANGNYWVAMVRFDHMAAMGYGEVCRIKLLASSSVWSGLQMAQLPISLAHCKLIAPDGSDKPVVCSAAIVRVYDQAWVAVTSPTGDYGWVLAPNPARTQVRLTLDARLRGDYTLQVLDLSGRELMLSEGTLAKGSGPNELLLSTAGLASGVYLVQLQVDGWQSTRRLSVVRE